MSEAEQWIGMRSPAPVRRIAAAWRTFGLGVLLALAPAGGGAAVEIGGPFELVDQNVALTGTPRELARLGRAYGVHSAVVPTAEHGGYVMDHTSLLYLIGPDGKYVRHFESDVSTDELIAALRQSVVGRAVGGS